jgi:hypothetical protein
MEENMSDYDYEVLSNTVALPNGAVTELNQIAGREAEDDDFDGYPLPFPVSSWVALPPNGNERKIFQLVFQSDEDDNMDYLEDRDDIIEILRRHRVSGDITFASPYRETPWGYRFDGQGGVVKLIGDIAFREVPYETSFDALADDALVE